MCVGRMIEEVTGHLQELVLSYLVGSTDRTQVFRGDGKFLYPLVGPSMFVHGISVYWREREITYT